MADLPGHADPSQSNDNSPAFGKRIRQPPDPPGNPFEPEEAFRSFSLDSPTPASTGAVYRGLRARPKYDSLKQDQAVKKSGSVSSPDLPEVCVSSSNREVALLMQQLRACSDANRAEQEVRQLFQCLKRFSFPADEHVEDVMVLRATVDLVHRLQAKLAVCGRSSPNLGRKGKRSANQAKDRNEGSLCDAKSTLGIQLPTKRARVSQTAIETPTSSLTLSSIEHSRAPPDCVGDDSLRTGALCSTSPGSSRRQLGSTSRPANFINSPFLSGRASPCSVGRSLSPAPGGSSWSGGRSLASCRNACSVSSLVRHLSVKANGDDASICNCESPILRSRNCVQDEFGMRNEGRARGISPATNSGMSPVTRISPLMNSRGLFSLLNFRGISPMTNSRRISSMTNSGGTSPTTSSGGTSPLMNSGGISPLTNSRRISPTTNSEEISPTTNSGGTSPLMNSGGTSPLTFGGTSPLTSFAGTSPLVGFAGTSPLVGFAGTSPLVGFAGTSPLVGFAGTSPLMNSAGTSPLMNSAGTSPLTNPGGTSPVAPSTNCPTNGCCYMCGGRCSADSGAALQSGLRRCDACNQDKDRLSPERITEPPPKVARRGQRIWSILRGETPREDIPLDVNRDIMRKLQQCFGSEQAPTALELTEEENLEILRELPKLPETYFYRSMLQSYLLQLPPATLLHLQNLLESKIAALRM